MNLKEYIKETIHSALATDTSIPITESAMSELDILAQEAKDLKSFIKTVYKEFKNLPKNRESLKWLEDIYNSSVNESVNEASADAYTLHRLADNPGEAVADEFLSKHNVDIKLLTKAIQQKTIGKYELRDIVKGTAQSSKMKKFIKDFVKESVVTEAKSMDMNKRLKVYDKLKKGDEITIKYGSSMSSGNETTFKVTKGKTLVGKQKVERIILQNVANPKGVKYYLYQRDGNVSLAIGNMAASIEDMSESVVTEGPEPQIKKIAQLTGARVSAVETYVSSRALNITKLLKYLKDEKYKGAMDFIKAVLGDKKQDTYFIKMFKESVVNEAKEPEVIVQLRKIVKDSQNDLIKDTKSGKKVRVDMNSANLMIQVYDALKKQSNKDKFVKSGIVMMGHTAFKLMKKENVSESGIMYKAGVKKYGKEGMTKIQSAAGKGEGHEEIGKIKDKYDKSKNEVVVNEFASSVNKRRAGAELKQKLKGKRSDGMGKYTATIYGLDSKGKRVELKSLNDLNKYSKFELDESVNEAKKKLPNFKKIPSWARYVAQQSDGEWTWYEETPTMIKFKDGGGAWKQDGNQTYTGVKTNGKDWDKIPTYYNVKGGVITESEDEEQIDEKLITFSNRAPYGQIVFMAGGAGSGKGFAISNFIDSAGFKVRDVDEMKTAVAKLDQMGKFSVDKWYKKYGNKLSDKAIKGGLSPKAHIEEFMLGNGLSISDIANPKHKSGGLKNPNNVASLHYIVDAMGLKDKWVVSMLSGKNNKETLPNLMFDITAKKVSSIANVIKQLEPAGYDSKNIHLIWVLADFHVAIKANKERDRMVPEDTLLMTHEGAGKTMWEMMTKILPKGLNGRIDVILNKRAETVPYVDSNGKPIMVEPSQQNKLKDAEIVVKGFTSLPIKKQGGGVQPESSWKEILKNWILSNAPKTVDLSQNVK